VWSVFGGIICQTHMINILCSPPTGNNHQGHPHKGFPTERDSNYDKLESAKPKEETLMSTLQSGIIFFISFI